MLYPKCKSATRTTFRESISPASLSTVMSYDVTLIILALITPNIEVAIITTEQNIPTNLCIWFERFEVNFILSTRTMIILAKSTIIIVSAMYSKTPSQ